MSILLVTIISMSENERRHNAKSAMSGLSHFCRPTPLSADQLLRKTRPIVEIKQLQCIVCVCDQNQTIVESKLHYCDVQSSFRAKCANCFSYAIFRVDLTASEYTNHYKNQFSLC